ncbi:hypothetical protein qu_929 [Acanthamoeba polyphaga mimivirus]|nr:hypothetical protein [Mimivirus reunion]WMV62263.1 hypothetical protein qu_929 [Mimivirus sp.]WMV63240.1 hypothetical protein qu_929 [Acanthamoeba polyphaga mimivirus]WMV64217.1 hypothetical protein qu_929 [Mimivirus sp.]
MEKYTVCLCGKYCPSKKNILKYCQVIDDDYYIIINDELLPIDFNKYIYHKYGANPKNDCIIIDFENILKFNDFMVSKKLLVKVDECGIVCSYFKFIGNYLEHITKNNVINHIKYYLKNNYYNKLYWNSYLQENIFKYSDVSTIRSCLKYLPIEYIDNYFFCTLYRNDNIILDYLINKIGIYLISYFTGKYYKGNMFKITNKDKLADIPDISSTLSNIIYYDKENENIIEIYYQAINRFQELLESQENINVKKELISKHDKLKLKLIYNEKVKNHLLEYSLIKYNEKLLQIVKQLLMDGANIYTTFDMYIGYTLFDYSVEIIIKKKNLDLLDILFEIKLIDKSKLNFILEKSMGEINFKNDTKLEIDKNFIRELSGYGADVDECFDKLIKTAKYNNNKKLVGYLKNLKDDLM